MNALKTRKEKFTEVYQNNTWRGADSISGTGSNLEQTAELRRCLPDLLRSHGIRSLMDAPCGDLHWMQHTDLGDIEYLGLDIVQELIEANRRRFPSRRFESRDIVADLLPKADAIFCRDCLVHLPLSEIALAVRNFIRSGAQWLLTTTFPLTFENRDVRWSGWRPLNLQITPFHFPSPQVILFEGCTEDGGKHADKALGLWSLADLRHV